MDDQRDDTTGGQASSDQPGTNEAGPDESARPRAAAGREMLAQLQQMIDTLAMQARPVMREVAAKAAELAAVAGERAGPVAHRAAAVTESVGQRVAARSKEVAADLRRSAAEMGSAAANDEQQTAPGAADSENPDAAPGS